MKTLLKDGLDFHFKLNKMLITVQYVFYETIIKIYTLQYP